MLTNNLTFNFRSTCQQFNYSVLQYERMYRDLLINEIIDIYEETMNRLGLQIEAIDRETFLDAPKCQLEKCCKLLKEVLEGEKNCFGQDLAHNGSIFHYFIVYYKSDTVNCNPLKYLMDLTWAVNYSSDGTLLNLTEGLETLEKCIDCLYSAEEVVGRRKVQKYLMMWNKSGNTILHEWAKKGNFFFCFNFLEYLFECRFSSYNSVY